MKKKGLKCNCIRCNEIGDKEHENHTPILVVRKYSASQGTEYHISIEAHSFTKYQYMIYMLYLAWYFIVYLFTGTRKFWSGDLASYIGLYGFLRLRIDPEPGGDFIPEIKNSALIREVHVYGTSMGVGVEGDGSQHRGFGKLLMKTAEQIAKGAGYKKTAVIAGVGTREYYKNKCGYHLEGTYMVKYI
jgi:elongator complex protein 3